MRLFEAEKDSCKGQKMVKREEIYIFTTLKRIRKKLVEGGME